MEEPKVANNTKCTSVTRGVEKMTMIQKRKREWPLPIKLANTKLHDMRKARKQQ